MIVFRLNKQYPIIATVLSMLVSISSCTDSNNNSSLLARSAESTEFAVIADTPYGERALVEFPTLVDAINNDPYVESVIHVGDIKSGETVCSDEWFWDIHWQFYSFQEPLIYSIGDNEWTDCHRTSNGAYNPLERLATLREIFFDSPGHTMGGRTKVVESQDNYPENQFWLDSEVAFATLHVVGSNNNMPVNLLTGNADTERAEASLAEYTARNAANLRWLQRTFDAATEYDTAGIALFFHADMWKQQTQLDEENFSGFREFVQRLAILAEHFGKPVLLISGDNHNYRVDVGVPWFSLYGASPVSNVTQIIVNRSIEFPASSPGIRREWLRLLVDPTTEQVFFWEQVRD